MPGLIGSDQSEVFTTFRDHLAALLNGTVTDARLSLIHVRNTDHAQVTFRRNSLAITAPVAADLFLYVGQTLRVAKIADQRWKLRTVGYREAGN